MPVIILMLALALPCAGQTRAEMLRARLLDPFDGKVFVAAHRADWRNAPENSVAAIESAVALGVDVVEIDVRRTVTGKLILNHNPVIFGPAGAATLEEALLAAKGKVLVNLDKAFGLFDEVMEVAERTGTVEQIIVKSSCRAAKAEKVLGKYRGRVIFMPIVNLNGGGALAKIEEYAQMPDVPVYELTFADDRNPVLVIVRARLEAQARLWFNTLWPSLCGGHDDASAVSDPEGSYGWMIDVAGAGVLQTDRSAEMIEYLKNR